MSEHEIVEGVKTPPEDNHAPSGQPPYWIILAVIVFFVLGAGMLVLLILNVPAPENIS